MSLPSPLRVHAYPLLLPQRAVVLCWVHWARGICWVGGVGYVGYVLTAALEPYQAEEPGGVPAEHWSTDSAFGGVYAPLPLAQAPPCLSAG